MTSTNGITSKSPTIIVPPVTISLRCLDSQNLRRACSIMMALLLATNGTVCQRQLKRKVCGRTRGTLTDACAFQSYLCDVWHLLQVTHEAIDAFVGVASTCQHRRLTVADRQSIQPHIVRHALANMTQDLLPARLWQRLFQRLELTQLS